MNSKKDSAAQLSEDLYPAFPEFADFDIDLSRVSAQLILELQEFRTTTGIPIIPSPLQDGWWRDTGSKTSRHYAVGRLSDAGDMFAQKDRILTCWLQAIQWPAFGGIGLYTDTHGPDGTPWPMMHVDMRPYSRGQKVLWVRDENEYINPRNQDEFWEIVHTIASNYV